MLLKRCKTEGVLILVWITSHNSVNVCLVLLFGSFGLSTKEPCTVHALSVVVIGVDIVCAHLSWPQVQTQKLHIWYRYAPMSLMYVHQIFNDSDLQFLNGSYFWHFSSICYPAHTDSQRDFMLHILMHLFFTYIHKRNNATVTYFLNFIDISLKPIYCLILRGIMCFDMWATKA